METFSLGVFTKYRKVTTRFVMSVRPSILPSVQSFRMKHLGSRLTDFDETRHLSFLRKTVEKIQILIKSEKNNGQCTRRLFNIYDITSLKAHACDRAHARTHALTSMLSPTGARTHTVMCIYYCLTRQKWSRERASILCNTYIACLVILSDCRLHRNMSNIVSPPEKVFRTFIYISVFQGHLY